MRPVRRGDRGPAVAEIRSILVGLGLLQSFRDLPDAFDADAERAVRAFQQSRGLSRRRHGRCGDLAGARRGPVAPRRPHPLPGDPRAARRRGRPHRCRNGCWRWGTTSGAPTASTARAPPGRSRSSSARSGCRRTAPAARTPCTPCAGSAARSSAAARPGCASPTRSATRAPTWSARSSSSTRVTAAPTRASSCPTARCAGPRPTWRSTSPRGWRAGSPPPGCGCT